MIETPIRVSGEAFQGRYVEPVAQASFVGRTIQAAKDAVRLRTCHSSRITGRPFQFLQDIWNLEQGPWTETDGGDTLLVFRSKTLEEAAPRLFDQQSLFPEDRLHGEWTAFDLLGQVLGDVSRSEPQDSALDYGMLDSVRGYSATLHHGMERATFGYRSIGSMTNVAIDTPLVARAEEALHRTPASRRMRLTGRLDMLRMSNRLFQLILDDGSRVRGIWKGESTHLRSLLGEVVITEGEAAFRANGDIVSLQADAAREALSADLAFSRRPAVQSIEVRRKLAQPTHGAFQQIVGWWPGDETDEEIAEYLSAAS